jgi:dihydroorotate dehydrogenase
MYRLIRPFLFLLDPESVHQLTLRTLEKVASSSLGRIALRSLFEGKSEGLDVELFGLHFPNPLGLAAGYDKDGLGLRGLACMGFGHIELGTVTLHPQPGNPRPRIFRLNRDKALVNRMGFPNAGANELIGRLIKKKPRRVVLGINIGKGVDTPIEEAVEDYTALLRLFSPYADYIALNVSSPNTIGLRRLQARQHLELLLTECALTRASIRTEGGKAVPLLVKLAPDLSEIEIDDALDVLLSNNLDGIIATNTTTSRMGLQSNLANERGGLSGAPLFRRSLDVVAHIRKMTGGKLPIIGVGGIMSGDDAKKMREAGASLIQLYTGLVYAGPGLVKQILKALQG